MINRRDLLKGAALSAAAATTVNALAAPAPLVREPLHVFAADPAKLASFRRGVQVMRSRKPSDPTSWFFQAAIHAVGQEAFEDALLVDADLLGKEDFFNRCPHFGAPSAEFLPWHRSYLYYFERILRDAAGDPTLCLPYWDYTAPGQRTFPVDFARIVLSSPAGEQVNPLYHRNRQLSFVLGTHALTDQAVMIDDLMLETVFFGTTDQTGFGGGFVDNNPGTKGRIERRPHDQIHFAIGGQIGDVSGAMADVPRAAFDPIFWIHHCNIDRLWALWSTQNDRTWGALPQSTWFDTDAWEFFDFDGSLKVERRRRFFNHRDLGYVYADEDLSLTPLPLPTTGGGINAFDVTRGVDTLVGKIAEPVMLSASEPTTINLSEKAQISAGAISSRVQSIIAGPVPERLILVFRNVTFAAIPTSGFDVYLSPAMSATRSSASFVGTFGLFGTGHHQDGHQHGTDQAFDVTDVLRSGAVDSERLVVSVVPFDLLASRAGEPLRNGVGLEVGGIDLIARTGSAAP